MTDFTAMLREMFGGDAELEREILMLLAREQIAGMDVVARRMHRGQLRVRAAIKQMLADGRLARADRRAAFRVEAGENASKAVALATVAEATQGERTDRATSGHVVPKSNEADDKEAKRLRAINRAPEPDAREAEKLRAINRAPELVIELELVPDAAEYAIERAGRRVTRSPRPNPRAAWRVAVNGLGEEIGNALADGRHVRVVAAGTR